MRSPSVKPRTRPATVRMTGEEGCRAGAAARANGAIAAPRDAAPSRRRRTRSMVSAFRRVIVQRPVLDQRGPHGNIAAGNTTQPEAMSTAVEYVQFAAHLR